MEIVARLILLGRMTRGGSVEAGFAATRHRRRTPRDYFDRTP